MTENKLELSTWQLDTAKFFREMEIGMSRDEIVNCLYKVFEELQYIDAETEVDQETRMGFVLLNKLLFTIVRSENETELILSIEKK
ncbi:MAG TPA: hypothetical protein VGF79_16130 [Bacteroidia bacterium]